MHGTTISRVTLSLILFLGSRLVSPLPLNSSLKRFSFSSIGKQRHQCGHVRPSVHCHPGGSRARFGLIARLLSTTNDVSESNARRYILKTFGALLLFTPPALEVYSRLGTSESDFSILELVPPPPKGTWDDVEHATLVFHGAGGQDKYTEQLMKSLLTSIKQSSYSSMIEWSKYSSNILQASFNGQRIGRVAVTQLLSKARNLKTVHLIGISVGAFAADAACNEVKSGLGESAFVQLTLLDPFTQRGIFDVGYGARNYGKSADYFQQYLNTDDPVPSTNTPLENSVCFDITDIRPEEVSFGHDWPVAYYGSKGKVGIVPPSERLPRGTIVKIDE